MVTGDLSTLRQGSFDHLAIANPKLAPYGRAAQQVLNANNLWAATQNKLVRGENIAQAFQFVKSGNAELGFVAYSQVKRNIANKHGSAWIVPESFYSPIEQQVVLLKDIVAAREFLSFVKTPASKKLIQSYGYGVDGAK